MTKLIQYLEQTHGHVHTKMQQVLTRTFRYMYIATVSCIIIYDTEDDIVFEEERQDESQDENGIVDQCFETISSLWLIFGVKIISSPHKHK